jgi:protein-tyrosine phosphatase
MTSLTPSILGNRTTRIFNSHLDEAHTYIKSMLQDHNVLVHCQMGMSRSSSLVIAFLMKEYGMDYHNARIYAQDRRKIVQLNEAFERNLLKFEEYLKKHHPKLFKK